jgi:ATP-dependent DNA helicase RecQ
VSDPESYLPRFGLSSFRHGQKEVIETVMSGRDCLCVMPTGGGKSLCYQLPALALDGLTLVVSPLIALMKDQVDQLQVLGLPVSFVNSALSAIEQNERIDRMSAGEFRLVYVAPERFRSGRFCEAVCAAGVKLLAVDEAHCISEWGHDFRPDYARLGYFRRLLGNPPTLALTATATDRVRRDIIDQLALTDPKTFITGFARPNLFYEVQSPRGERQKPETLIRFLRETPGSGIIYTSTRRRAEEVGALLAKETKRRATVYHAGLLPDQRREAQDDFMDGRSEIVVATNAFGMGIDKPDVRFVVHYNLPGSIEAYYQEAGRAGRDGKPSRCLMIFHPSDRYIQEFFIDTAYPDREHVQAVYEFLCEVEETPIEMTQDEIKQTLNLPIGGDGIGNCEQLLESAGVLERLIASQNSASVRIDSDLPTLVDLLPKQATMQRKVLHAVERLVGSRRQELIQFNHRDLKFLDDIDPVAVSRALHELCRLEAFTYVPPFRGRAIRMIERDRPFDTLEIDFAGLHRRKELEYEKLNRVVRFAMGGGCRQREILRYFGEENAELCGHCDNCRRYDVARTPTSVHVDLAANHLDAASEAAVDEDVLKTVRIVLSGVARTQARFSCGKNLIAQMLCGSGSSKVSKLHLDKLSTFGLLKHLAQTEVVMLIDALVAMECLQQVDVDRFRPVVELTELGHQVMTGSASFDTPLPIPPELSWKLAGGRKKAEGERAKAEDARREPLALDAQATVEPESGIVNALRQWRADVAEEAGVPLHYILSNDTLTELARHRPANAEQLRTIRGIGPVKAERYGRTLLEIVGDEGKGQVTAGVVEPKVAAKPEKNEDAAPLPSSYWTHRLLKAGFSIDECVAIRGLDRVTILRHAEDHDRQ